MHGIMHGIVHYLAPGVAPDAVYPSHLQVGKGRDMGFVAVNGFEQKISAGNAMQLISRDLYRVAKGVDLYRLLSMFFTGTGFYLSTMITIWSVSIFVLCHLVLTLTGSAQYDQYIWNNDPAAKSIGGGGHRQLDAAARQPDDGAPSPQEVLLSCVAAGQQWLCATVAGPGDTGGAGVAAEAPFGEGHEEAEYIVATWQVATHSPCAMRHAMRHAIHRKHVTCPNHHLLGRQPLT